MSHDGVVVQVNAHQWGKLQGREDVRLVDRERASRTIIASYKNAHSTFCEFVADEEESKAVAAGGGPGPDRLGCLVL